MTFSFIQNNKPLEQGPICGMTTIKDGTMRFRWNETNSNRNAVFQKICSANNWQNHSVCPVELIHSKIVYDVKDINDTKNLQGDGIITINRNIIPTVTVADCVPIYLYNPEKKVFGIVHSGWKGTGIIQNAIELCNKNYGTKTQDFCIVIGPHIRDCCYIVNQERADYFSTNFTPDCIKPLEQGGQCYCGGKGLPVVWNNGGGQLYRLSLLKANLAVLEKLGIKKENIQVIDQCTCCNQELGSNRRETAFAGKPDAFTVQAAYIGF